MSAALPGIPAQNICPAPTVSAFAVASILANAFDVDGKQVSFSFHPVNIQRPQLYQVYYTIENKETRFHMQINDQGNFVITDPLRVTPAIHSLQDAMSDAILDSVAV